MKKIVSTVCVLFLALPLFCRIQSSYPVPFATFGEPSPFYRTTSLAEDSQGYLWLGTAGDGLYRFDGTNYIRYNPMKDGTGLLSSHINSILCDSSGRLWIGTQKGVNRYDESTHSFVKYPINDWNNYVVSVIEDGFGRIFILTQVGLLKYNDSNSTFSKVIVFKDQLLVDLFIASDGSIWILYRDLIEHYDANFNYLSGTPLGSIAARAVFDGIDIIYIQSAGALLGFSTLQNKQVVISEKLSAINPSDIRSMFRYSDSKIVVVTDIPQCYDFLTDRLYDATSTEFPYDWPADVNNVIEGKNSVVWGVTNENRIVRLDTDITNPYKALCKQFDDISVTDMVSDGRYIRFVERGHYLVTFDLESRKIAKSDVYQIIGTQRGFGSYEIYYDKLYDRLFIFGGSAVFEIRMKGFGRYSLERKYVKNTASPISAITVDKRKKLWASCRQDPNLYYAAIDDGDDNIEMTQLDVHPQSPRLYVTKMMTLRNGNLAAAYVDIGIVIVDAFTRGAKFIKLSDKYNQMFVNALYEDNAGNVWVGTSDVGLFVYNQKTGTIRAPEQFEGKNISSIAGDTDGKPLIVTESTVYKYDEQEDSFTPVWRSRDNLMDQDGRVFTFSDGYSILNIERKFIPFERERQAKSDVPLDFGVILMDGKSNVLDLFDSSELKGKNGARVSLMPQQNNLQLALSFRTATEVPFMYRYSYSVKYVADGWEEAFGHAQIPLYNMSYGKHKVKIRVLAEPGQDDGPVETLTIFIRRPWYFSTVAKLLYLAEILLLVLISLYFAKQRNEKRLEADRIRHEKELQQQLNQENVDFFANMSHELRTPLSLISGAANVLSKSQNSTVSEQRLQKIILRNSDRMMKLVTQILDFNKLEHNKLKLNVEFCDVSGKINDIVEIFAVGAQQKGIELSVDGTRVPILVWLDNDKFEKILYNILSNAIKYTPQNGKVKVTAKLTNMPEADFNGAVDLKGDCLVVSVSDNGIGIPEDSLTQIFERFGQALPSQKEGGTGIGLHFAKSMIELHHGVIQARNESGAVFTFALPAEKGAYSDEERSILKDENKSVDNSRYLSEYTIRNDYVKPEYDCKVLIIDDDYEIIYFLKSILSPYYSVVTSFDAVNGYKLIETENPDIIVSDIMMVEMDGLQLCRMVKDNINMCHIPFILLTAKDTMGNQIEGLNSGADAYIVKPFNPDYLIAMIKTLIRNRENVRHLIGSSSKVEKRISDNITPRDHKLLERIYELFEKNLANADINAAQFAEECGISRTKFFYKVKALTGMTPSDYFRVYKLNRSLEFLKEDKYKIASIAEMCGFSSPSHFSMLFKKQFGMLPSEYLDKMPLDDK